MQRKSVNFSGSTSADVASFFVRGSPEHAALGDLVGEELSSESDVLRALVKVGIRSVRDHQLEKGYAELAESADDEDRQWAESSMRSAEVRWADDDL